MSRHDLDENRRAYEMSPNQTTINDTMTTIPETQRELEEAIKYYLPNALFAQRSGECSEGSKSVVQNALKLIDAQVVTETYGG